MNQEKLFRRGSKPKDVQLDSDIVDQIKNSMLKYQTESQYYVYMFDQDILNAILTLTFLKKGMMTKNINTKIKGVYSHKQMEQGWAQEMKDVYFDIKVDQLNVVQQVRKASESFNNHETLIIGIFQHFKKLQIVNLIFEHEFYKNKLRIQEVKASKLEPFNKITFKEKDSKAAKNDLIIMKQPDGNGIFLLCFSSEKVKPERISISEQQVMRKSRKNDSSIKDERNSSGEKEKTSKSDTNNKEQTFDQKQLQMTYSFDEDKKVSGQTEEKICSLILVIVIIVLAIHFYIDKINNYR